MEDPLGALGLVLNAIVLLLGRYSFTASVPAAGALRLLRDLGAPELDEDEDESVGSE
ncbi:hypothetical protein ACWC5C_20995 [Streptomyces sp. NPDC001700]